MKRTGSTPPTPEEVKRVIRHLERHQLSVYGPNFHLTSTRIFAYGACRDYSAAEAVKLIKLLDAGVQPEEVDPS